MRRISCRVIAAVLALFLGFSAPRQARGDAASDSTTIGAIVADLDSSWARADAALWASHYTPDAEFINILGMLMPDVKSMRDRHHEIFHGVFRGSRHHGTLRRVRFLGPDAAIADVDVEVTGFQALPPGSVPTAPGVLRTRMRHVFSRVGGTWKILASQNTAVAPK